MMGNRPLAITPTCRRAYVDKERAAIEALLDDDFQFTSPIDNVLDRATYMKICWPNSKLMRVLITYTGVKAETTPSSCTRPGHRRASAFAIARCTLYVTASSWLLRSISVGICHTRCPRGRTWKMKLGACMISCLLSPGFPA